MAEFVILFIFIESYLLFSFESPSSFQCVPSFFNFQNETVATDPSTGRVAAIQREERELSCLSETASFLGIHPTLWPLLHACMT